MEKQKLKNCLENSAFPLCFEVGLCVCVRESALFVVAFPFVCTVVFVVVVVVALFFCFFLVVFCFCYFSCCW